MHGSSLDFAPSFQQQIASLARHLVPSALCRPVEQGTQGADTVLILLLLLA